MNIVSLLVVILHCARNFESVLFLFLVSQNFEMQVANDIKSSGSNLFSRTRDIKIVEQGLGHLFNIYLK